MFMRKLKNYIHGTPSLERLSRWWLARQVIPLDFRVQARPRWTRERPHPELQRILEADRATFDAHVAAIVSLTGSFTRIGSQSSADDTEPVWINSYIPPQDGMILYTLLVKNQPARYLEIGSGHSTKFARRAIRDHRLATRITSIDPEPRARIDTLADEIIRQPLEALDFSLLARLSPGDLLFYDGSHRCFMNSDVTVFFLEVLPRVPAGVYVHIHDITLPFDYPADWACRWYSEQYLLAAMLLAGQQNFSIEFPSTFVTSDRALSDRLAPLRMELGLASLGGCSFWLLRRR